MCTQVIITALYIIAKKWKQPKYTSAYKWINKVWYIYTVDFYSSIERNIDSCYNMGEP